MARAGCKIAWGIVVAVALIGCRTPQPELKPAPQPEVLTVPPKEARFNKSQYPDLAFRDLNNKYRQPLDSGDLSNPIRPARAQGGPSNMMPAGGMGGLR